MHGVNENSLSLTLEVEEAKNAITLQDLVLQDAGRGRGDAWSPQPPARAHPQRDAAHRGGGHDDHRGAGPRTATPATALSSRSMEKYWEALKNIYNLFKILGNYESSTGSAHYYSESRHHGEPVGGAGAEMAELSPGYSHGGYADPAAEEGAETSGSGSAEDGSGSEDTDEGARGYEGCRCPASPSRSGGSRPCPPSTSTRTPGTRPRQEVSRGSGQ